MREHICMNRLPRALDRTRFTLKVAALVACTAVVGAQTRITPPKNKYTPQQDVEIGREAAAEVRREYPVIDDRQIDSYLDGLGQRLVAAAPAELKHEVFEYSFTPVNLKDINAFALPGGPMFVNRGMFAAAATRRRGRGRDGPRAEPRAASAWHRERHQGARLSAGRTGRRHRRRGDRRRRGSGHLAGFAVRSRHLAAEVQPRIREAGRPARRADHGARRLRSSRPRPHVRDHCQTGQWCTAPVAEQPP